MNRNSIVALSAFGTTPQARATASVKPVAPRVVPSPHGDSLYRDTLSQIAGNSTAIAQLRRRIRQFAPLQAPVLILGETGTGKELAARALHELSPQAHGPFVPVNCGALNDSLLEDVLFGHEKGAFTGAGSAHRGVFEQADGGTLFFDEIGEMPLAQQSALLRVLETGLVCRIGSETHSRVSFRLVTATHRALPQMVEAGKFRLDLFHRIAVLDLETPPLHQRHGDISLLATHFLAELTRGGPKRVFSEEALLALERYHWPGNIRELQNAVMRAWATSERSTIQHTDLRLGTESKKPRFRRNVLPFGDAEIADAMRVCDGNVTAAARYLAVPRSTLRNRLRACEPQCQDASGA
ncbi:MAG: sigma-54 dependent transcriptional regulator [Proteobacteria bacterium]|nr:sigma-54 dependent transcriptional regulator [Pseudomonadota bacterium]